MEHWVDCLLWLTAEKSSVDNRGSKIPNLFVTLRYAPFQRPFGRFTVALLGFLDLENFDAPPHC
jgi:hypothetical protein